MPKKELDNTQIDGLQRLLSLLNPNTLTTETFKENFKRVLDFQLKQKNQNQEAVTKLNQFISDSAEKLKRDNNISIAEVKAEFTKIINKALKDQANGMNFLMDKVRGLTNGKDGKNASIKKVVRIVLKKIKLPKQKATILDTPVQIAEKLELLEDENRLDIKAIRGLEELLKELKQRPVGASGAGVGKLALEARIVDDEDLTTLTTPNSSETDFPLENTPQPASSVVVFRNGQRQKLGAAKDYTFSGRTITFLRAPDSDEELAVDYRI